MQNSKKKIELSKETMRDLTARPLTKQEQDFAAGGTEASRGCTAGQDCNTENSCPCDIA